MLVTFWSTYFFLVKLKLINSNTFLNKKVLNLYYGLSFIAFCYLLS